MAEYVVVPSHILYPIPDTLDYRKAAMIEPVSIAFHAVQRHRVQFNETVHVVGCGIIGSLTILAARLAGCGRVIATDLKPERLALAEQLGADVVINAGEYDVVDRVRELTAGDGADVCFEAVGVGPTVNAAIGSVRKGGPVVLIGNVTPEVSVPLQRIVTGELAVLGSCASAGEYAACVQMVASGRMDVEPLMSEVAPLSDGARWFKRLHEGADGYFKVILEP
jgi:L-iditol 2-dehydrogenase